MASFVARAARGFFFGKSEIPTHIVNLDDIVKGEISENTQRKDFFMRRNNAP
jgi:hypothetical protein